METQSYKILILTPQPGPPDLSLQILLAEAGLPNFSLAATSVEEDPLALVERNGYDAVVCQFDPPAQLIPRTLRGMRELADEVAVVAVIDSRYRNLTPSVRRAGARDCVLSHELSSVVLQRSLRYAVESKHVEHQLQQLERYDKATGLLAQLAFLSLLDRWMCRVHRGGFEPFALLVLEIEKLHEYVHRFGQGFIETALARTAQRIQNAVRPGDTTAILAGNEFVMLMPSIDRAHQARRAANRLVSLLSRPLQIHGHTLAPSVRSGISLFQPSFVQGREMLEHAVLNLGARKELEQPI